MEPYPENMEANTEEIESKSEQREDPKEENTVNHFGALKVQYGDWHLATGCRQQMPKWTQGNGGS